MGAGTIFALTQAGRTDDLNDQPWLSFVLAGFSAALLWAAADGMFRRIGWDGRKVVFRKMSAAPRTAASSGVSEMTISLRAFLADVER